MAVPYYDFLTSAPTDQTGSALGTNFDYYNAFLNNSQYYQPGTGTADVANFTIGDQEYSFPSGSTYGQLEKYMTDKGASDLLTKNTGAIKPIDDGSDSTGIGEIILPPIAGGGGGGGGGVEGAIDYNNLTLRDQSTGTGIDSDVAAKFKQYKNYKFTDQDYANTISKLREYNPNFNSYTDQDLKEMIDMGAFKNFEPQKTGILEGLKTKGNALLDFIKKGGVIGNIASELLPEQDPRATALRDFYGDNFGLTSSGSVASGIMQNYNPVSGGFLNMITGGKYGDETQYGLTPAIDKRIAKINETLKKYDKYKYGSKAFDQDKYNQQIEKIKKLEAIKQKEALALKEAQEKVKEKEYQDRIAREADTAARARAANAAVYREADNRGYTNRDGGFSTSRADKAGTSAGSGQGFSNKSGKGRTGYGKGGIVTL
jgi:hypothetical protein